MPKTATGAGSQTASPKTLRLLSVRYSTVSANSQQLCAAAQARARRVRKGSSRDCATFVGDYADFCRLCAPAPKNDGGFHPISDRLRDNELADSLLEQLWVTRPRRARACVKRFLHGPIHSV